MTIIYNKLYPTSLLIHLLFSHLLNHFELVVVRSPFLLELLVSASPLLLLLVLHLSRPLHLCLQPRVQLLQIHLLMSVSLAVNLCFS